MHQQPISLQFARLVVLLLLAGGTLWEGLYTPVAQVAATGVLATAVLALGGRAVWSRKEIALWGAFGLAVALSLLKPAAAGTAVHGPLVAAGWVLAFTLGRIVTAEKEWLEALLARIWSWSGPVVVIGGMLLLPYQAVHHSGRLASVLGYPIAVGALGMLGLAGCLGLAGSSGRRRWVEPLLLYGNMLAILLSGSRGVWAASAVLLIVLSLRLHVLRSLLVPGLLAVAAALWAGPAIAQGQSLVGVIVSVVMGLTILVAPRFRSQAWIYAVIALVLWRAPGWSWLLGRAATLAEGSSIERLTFLRDGLTMVIQHPLGAGFRAWHPLHLQGASYGYYSTEAHSALVDLTLAFGWLGGAAFLGFLVVFLVRLGRPKAWSPVRTAILAGLAGLALHGLLDWTLSYALFAIPLWMGVGLSRTRSEPGVVVPRSVLGVFAGICLAAAVWLASSDVFTNLAQTEMSVGNHEAAGRHAAMAVAIQPWNDVAYATLAQANGADGGSQEALGAVARARQLGPHEPWYATLEGELLRSAGRPAEAAEAFRDAALLWPWEVNAYETALSAMIEMSLSAQIRGDLGVVDQIDAIGAGLLQSLDRQRRREPIRTPRKPMELKTAAIMQARAFFQPDR